MASNPKAPSSPTDKSPGLVKRGVYKSNKAGIASFVCLRALDPVLQYGILGKGIGSSLLHKLGLDTLPAGPPNTGTFLDGFGLSPYRLILLSMATGSAVKHILWLTAFSNEEYTPAAAAEVSGFNTVMNSINTLLFTAAATSASLSSGSQFPQTPLLIGSGLYVAGMAIEIYSEWERKQFKDDPKNAGQLYTGGAWSLTRHANYLGYTLWRVGFSVAASGWTLGAITTAFFVSNFVLQSIPSIEEYTSTKVSHFGLSFSMRK
jgi:protein-S-isoprenylcysteine O-methyltransferase Ste14